MRVPFRPKAAAVDPAAAEAWLAALETGSAESVGSQVLGQGEDAAPGVRALGSTGGERAVPLLELLIGAPVLALAIAAAAALGDTKAAAAAAVLQGLDRPGAAKDLRSAARRSLHRLSSAGIAAPRTAGAPAARPGARLASVYRVIASAYDGNGSRSLWFAAERPLGGVYSIGLVVNDVLGLLDCTGRDTTRKRFNEQEQNVRQRDPMAWVELPVEYARQLVQEALDLGRTAGHPAPTGYVLWAESIGEPEAPFSEALIYQELSAFEMKMHPALQGEAAKLFEQPEIEPWFFAPARVDRWARQLSEPPSQRLVITPETEQSRVERLLREAVAELFPAQALRGLRRRLEETAYIFRRTGRETDARRALAAAVTIEEQRPLRAPHPFLRMMIERSIEIARRVQRTGFEPPVLGQGE
ncbi:MAG: hypothetical protein HY534_02860 [Chloroflexi bacterium]|nr:hypothetical protein [Chloroflexota bacterium]